MYTSLTTSDKKYKACQKLRNAVYRKKIKKEPCHICFDKKSQGHHEDYDKPLVVIWLCFKHHKELHLKLKKQMHLTNKK